MTQTRDPILWVAAKAATRATVDGWFEAGSPFTRYAVGRELRRQYRKLTDTDTATNPVAGPPLRGMAWSREALDAMVRQQRAITPPEILQKMEADLAEPGEPPPCPTCNGARFVRLLVGRDDPNFGKPIPCECAGDEPVEALLDRSGIPPNYRSTMRFEDFKPLHNPTAFKALNEWSGGESLCLYGRPGRGKTHLAVAALRKQIEQGVRGYYEYLPDFLDEIRRRYGDDHQEDAQSFFDRITAAPLLLLDDLGAEKATDWAVEKITAVIDRRLRGGLPTIVTTNFETDGEVADRIGPRAASRLASYRWVLCEGVDMRVPA